jgi:uncharacterized membrane protein
MRWTHEETIDAPADVVWRLNSDVADWPSFLPTVRSVERLDEGPLRLGARARIKQPGQPLAVWEVTDFEPGREFSWRSERRGMTFVGRHQVTPEGAGTRNALTIEMTGPLTAVLGPLLAPAMRRVLRTEGSCFKTRAEGRTPAAPTVEA